MKKQSEARTVAGVVLLLLSSLGMAAALVQVGPRIILAEETIPTRIWVVLSLSVTLLGLAGLVIRDRSLLWQVLLQVFAAAGIVVGLSILLDTAFSAPFALWSREALWGAIVLAAGVSSAMLMRRLQRRRKTTRRKQRTLLNKRC